MAVALGALAVGSLPWLDPVAAAHRVRRSGRRGRVRSAGRHPVRHRRQPGHAGRDVERTTVPKGYGGPWSASGWPSCWPPAPVTCCSAAALAPNHGPPAGPGTWPDRGRAAVASPADREHRGDRRRARPAPRRDRVLARLRHPARRPAVHRPARAGRSPRIRARGELVHAPGIVRHEEDRPSDQAASTARPALSDAPRSGPRRVRAARPGAAAARAGLGGGRAAAPGLVPRRLPGRGARDRRQPRPR